MNPAVKKDLLSQNYVHKTQEERSKSQNKNYKYPQRIKSSRPAFSSKKENDYQDVQNGEGNGIERFNELRKEINNHISSATEIAEISTTKAKKENNSNQSFLNDFSLNIQVSNSLNTKKLNNVDEKVKGQTIQEYDVEETQRLLINQKKNNFLKNNLIQDQKIQNNNINGVNNYPNNPNVAKITKSNAIKIRQRSNSPTILKMQGIQGNHQNRIISANLHSKAINLHNNGISEFKINGQSNKKKEQEETTINSNDDSISSTFQKERIKQIQGVVKPISQLQQNIKKKDEKGSVDKILSSNNSSDVENNNEDTSKDRRVKSISITPGIVLHNQFNLKESQNTFDALETSSYTNVSDKRKSIESENKLPKIHKVVGRQKETTLYNQLRESNQKNALELPQIIDNIKQNVNSCENLFKNRLKDRLGGFQGQFQQASANNITKNKDVEMNQYDFEVQNGNRHEQFDKAIAKSKKGRENIPISILNRNMNHFRQVESAKKRDSTIIQNNQKTKDDSSVKQESPHQIHKYIRQSQHSEQRESVNRRDSSISYKQNNNSTIQQSIQVRNRIKSEHNVMQNNSIGNYPEKLITEDSEGEPNSTADRKKLKKLNQINKYLKNKMDIQKQIINQVGSQQGGNGGNSIPLQNNSTNINTNISNVTHKTQPHNKVQLQIQQQQLLQISKNQQIALSNQKQNNSQNDNNKDLYLDSPKIQLNDQPKQQQIKYLQQKGVIEVLDQALFKRKEDKVNKSISQQIEKEIDRLNILTSKSSSARDEQLKIQEELIKYNLKIKLNKMKIVDTVIENEQEEHL